MSGDSLSCVSSVPGTGVGSLESCVAGIGFSKFVALGMTVGSTTGFVSVLIPLELDPGVSVGVLTKIFPLRCRGSVPSGGSYWLRRSTCAPFEKRKSCERSSFLLVVFVSVDRQAFTFAEMSQVFRCASQKSSLHHDPDCAMSFFVLFLAPTRLLSQNCRRTQPCTFVFVQNCRGTPAESWAKNPHSERRLSSSKHEFHRASVEQHVCVDSVLLQREIRLRRATTPSWLTAVLPVSRPSTP